MVVPAKINSKRRVCLLVGRLTSNNMPAYLRDRSAKTILRSATLR